MHQHKKRVGLLGINIRTGGNIQLEGRDRSTELNWEGERVGRRASVSD